MINSSDLRGIIVPIVTPVDEDANIDYTGLRNVVRHVLDGGVHGIIVLGGTGNFCSFSGEERFQITRAVVQEVRGRVPVLVGCMDSNTRLVLHNVARAYDAGADGVMVEAPYYYLCTDEDVLEHFTRIAAASALPILVYHNPLETKVRHGLAITQKLAALPKVIGIKDSSSDFVHFQSLLAAFAGHPFSVLQGQETLAGASFLLGANGAILALANVVPDLCVRLFDTGSAGQVDQCRSLQAQLMRVAQLLKEDGDADGPETTNSFFAGLHAALNTLGICQRIVTPPFRPPSPVHYERTRLSLAALAT